MPKCTVHIDFFHNDCNGCKEEYKEVKGISEVSGLSATEPNNNYDSTQAYKGRIQRIYRGTCKKTVWRTTDSVS